MQEREAALQSLRAACSTAEDALRREGDQVRALRDSLHLAERQKVCSMHSCASP